MGQIAESSVSNRRDGKSPGAFRTISEVATVLDVPQHVLRFWETKFAQVRPLKRGGGRRYYRPEDVDLLRRIRELLYTEGYTIKGVQRLLREGGVKSGPRVAGQRTGPNVPPPVREARNRPVEDAGRDIDPKLRRELKALLKELVEVRKLLRAEE
ncbi:MAG: MerR family transcriptional regulator [Alphaproteobacteria bacterium]|nr:MerR family transcriptional regulator [Alphaproteobacteria bacterium]